jgi:RimJ/RimL family protein N-acetyltransferase
MTAHIWIEYGRAPSRAWYAIIFDYPFNQLKVKKLIGKVAEDNEDAVKLDEHFGFVLEATVHDYSPSGALKIYTMVREQCRILNSPLWARTVARVAKCS